MTTPVTLRIRQQGYVRSQGYQATQWAVTIPVSDPPTDPPIATDPLSFAPLFVIRNSAGFDVLERVATLVDYENIPQAELEYFDIKGTATDDPFTNSVVGDVFRITSSVPFWIQAQAPYDTLDFELLQKINRAQGTGAKCFITGKQLQLTGYTFSDADIGRYVLLSDFSNAGNNGFAKILSYAGNTATVDKTFVANEISGSWAFPWFRMRSVFPGLEPRYFPTRSQNLNWEIRRAGTPIISGTGGYTDRNTSAELCRSVRYTELSPTLDSAEKLFLAVRGQVGTLQRAATLNNTAFTVLITYTVGP